MKFDFDGLLFAPPGCTLRVDAQRRVIGDRNFHELFRQFKDFYRQEMFDMTLNDGLRIGYKRFGQTAGHMVFMQDENGEVAHVHAFTLFLSRLDDTDDRAAVDSIREAQTLLTIPPDMFEKPLEATKPVVASYFTCQASMDHRVLYDFIRLAGGAFFDQFGLGNKEHE